MTSMVTFLLGKKDQPGSIAKNKRGLEMKVIIAGGGGLLGSALSTSLIKDGHEVVIFTRNPDGLDWQVPGSRLVKWSTENMRGWASELDGSDVVINLAGASIAGNNPLELRWTTKRKQAIRESRKKAGEAITKAFRLAKKKPSVLIQASAIGAYGPSTELNLDETSPRGNDFLATVTQDWEVSSAEVEEMGVRRIMLRTGLVLTRHGGLLPLLMLPYYFLAKTVYVLDPLRRLGGRGETLNRIAKWFRHLQPDGRTTRHERRVC